MSALDWEAEWSLDVTSTEPKALCQKVVVRYKGSTTISDVRMPIVLDEAGLSGEDHLVPVTIEPGMTFEVRYFLLSQPVWLQIVQGSSVGDPNAVLAQFASPFRR